MEELILFISKSKETKLRNFGIVLTHRLYKELNNETLFPIFDIITKHFKSLDEPDYLAIYETMNKVSSVDHVENKIISILWALYADIYNKNELKNRFTNLCIEYRINVEMINNAVKAA